MITLVFPPLVLPPPILLGCNKMYVLKSRKEFVDYRLQGGGIRRRVSKLTPVKLLGCEEEEESPAIDIPPIIVTGGIVSNDLQNLGPSFFWILHSFAFWKYLKSDLGN